MPELHLVDEETTITYVFNLTEKEFARATTDLQYRTQLLANAKNIEKNATNVEKTATNVEENVEENAIQDVMQDITNVGEINDGFRWIDQAVKLLLTAYREHEHLLNTCKTSVKRFWEIISEKLKEKSYNITGLQCKSKFNGLKKTYKSIKDHNNKSGNNRRIWPYFEIMDEIFGQKPWVTPVLTLDTCNSIPSPTSSISNNSSPARRSPSPCTSERPRKRPKIVEETALEKLLAIAQESKEDRKKMHEEFVARQDRFLDLFEKMVNKNN